MTKKALLQKRDNIAIPNIRKKLFFSMLTLSAVTFGGGYVIVPLMKKRFADKNGWFSENEILELVAIAQSCPGAMALNTATLVGYKMAGFSGAVISVLGCMLPPLVILSAFSVLYKYIRDNNYVAAAFRGMQAGIAAVIADVVISMAKPFFKRGNFANIVIMILAFVSAFIFNINAAVIILACAGIGAVLYLINNPAANNNRGGDA